MTFQEIKVHAVFDKDENFWIDFKGEVPRVGDTITLFSDQAEKENEETGEVTKLPTKYIVEKVKWFFTGWKINHLQDSLDIGNNSITLSGARVLVKPIITEIKVDIK